MWRTDLEGLRVVAILLVALYHVWFGRVSGGVDVFLMMSGFFVGGSLWRRFAADTPPKPIAYLKRHLRRLLPAAIVVLAATVIGTLLILPQTRWNDAAAETLASLFFYENWQLVISGAEYGAADPNQSAWQHFWSIGVQAQLFVLVPLALAVVWFATRRLSQTARRRSLALTLVIAAVASFGLATFQMLTNPALGYLSTATRAWQFLVGMLLAIALSVWTPKNKLWPALSWLAMGMLLATGMIVFGGAVFPGPWALLPIGAATVMVIAGATSYRWGVSSVLALPWVANLGKYAYGFYLWHWPILILSTVYRGKGPGWKVGILILVLSGVLAFLTYHLVEKPLREGGSSQARAVVWRRTVGTVTVAAMLGLVIVPVSWQQYVERERASVLAAAGDFAQYPGGMTITQPLIYADVPQLDPIPSIELAKDDRSIVVADGCVASAGDTAVNECEYEFGSTKRVALFGASHSEHLFEIAAQLAMEESWTLVPIIKRSCPPSLPGEAHSDECATWMDAAMRELEGGSFDLIITVGTRPTPGGGDSTPDRYLSLFAYLQSVAPVLAVRDNPTMPFDVPDCLIANNLCESPLADLVSAEYPDHGLERSGVVTVDTNDLICPDGLCSGIIGNRVVYRDSNHLTVSYVESIKVEAAMRWREALVVAGFSEPR